MRKPSPARKPAPVQFSGGVARGLGPVPAANTRQPPKPAPRHHARKPPPRVIPGGVMQRPKPAKKRQLTPDSQVALCSARAVAESLRLALGCVAGDEDVLALYELTADGPDDGATIEATLETAAEHGLARKRPLTWGMVEVADFMPAFMPARCILGLDLPVGPHAVLDDGTAWWSWGQPHDPADFPAAVIEEAWQVTW